jgi:hypothetical protein
MSLPKIGAKLKPNQTGWAIKRGGLDAEVLSPMSGTVMATNHNAVRHPDNIKKDPYGQGWLLVIDPGSGLKVKTKNLLFEQKAISWLHAEVEKLEDIVMNVYGVPLAATGGEIVDDIFGNLQDVKWEDIVHKFLLT